MLKPDIIILLLYFFWLIILTFILLKFYLYYSRLARGGKKESLFALLDNIVNKEEIDRKDIIELEKRIGKLEKEGLLHLQKVGLLRFNPFKDTGGDQSFTLALLDAKDTGVVISSLHTRTGTRWYAKSVINGKGTEYELSDEEKKALKESKFLIED